MRGHLIFPFLARVHRLNTRATAETDPDGAGPLAGGFDVDFKESVLVDRNDDGIGELVRREHDPIWLPCQVESDEFETLEMLASGNSPRSRLKLVFHFMDLGLAGLVDGETGDALIRPGDRLGGIYDKAHGLVQEIRTPPGLYVDEARPIGFGLNRFRPRRNLLLVSFSERQTAAARGA